MGIRKTESQGDDEQGDHGREEKGHPRPRRRARTLPGDDVSIRLKPGTGGDCVAADR